MVILHSVRGSAYSSAGNHVDAAADEENPWFMAYDDDWDTSNDEPVDEDMAQSVINSYTDNYAKLDWTILVQE